MECSICFNPIVDKVSMTCSSQHPFCFKCLLQNVEANAELKSCPNCRGGDKFIMLTNDTTLHSNDSFYSLQYFKKSLPIIQKILGDIVTANTCLISETILVFYVKNKKQIDAVHKLMSVGESLDTVVSVIRWDERRNLEDIGVEMIGGLAELFGIPPMGSHSHIPSTSDRPSSEQRRQQRARTTHESTERGSRVIFGTGPPPPGSFVFPFTFGGGGE